MSPNPYPSFTISIQDKPARIEKRIGFLVRLYLVQHEPLIAEAVVMHINALLSFPMYISDAETRCQFRHLAEHWRALAWTNCYGD